MKLTSKGQNCHNLKLHYEVKLHIEFSYIDYITYTTHKHYFLHAVPFKHKNNNHKQQCLEFFCGQ